MLTRLSLDAIKELKQPLKASDLISRTSNNIQRHLVGKAEIGGLIPPRSFEGFLDIFLKESPESEETLKEFTRSRKDRLRKLKDVQKKALAEQKEALMTAFNIAGIDKSEIRGWDYSEEEGPKSFLDGLNRFKEKGETFLGNTDHVYLREDAVLSSDMSNFPEFKFTGQTKQAVSTFKKGDITLKVILANRRALEELTGTDLIYYNVDLKCFTMVQYKMMESEKDDFTYRFPDKQLEQEIARMDELLKFIKPLKNNNTPKDYRINSDPFFIKTCPRKDFNPHDIALSNGMYLPLEYLKILLKGDFNQGKRGGKLLSYNEAGRHFNNTTFKSIIENGWIGTNEAQSNHLEFMIKNTMEEGRAVVIAMKKVIKSAR